MRAFAIALLLALLTAHAGALVAHRMKPSITVHVIYEVDCDDDCEALVAGNRIGQLVANNLRSAGGFQPIVDITSWISRTSLYSSTPELHVVFVLRGSTAREELDRLEAITREESGSSFTLSDILSGRKVQHRATETGPTATFYNLSSRDAAAIGILDLLAMAVIVLALGVLLYGSGQGGRRFLNPDRRNQ